MIREDRERLVEAWKASGQSGRAYCRENNLNYWTFRWWLKKEKTNQPSEKLVKLDFPKDTSGPEKSGRFEVALHDVRILVPEDFSEEGLVRLLRTLRKAL